MKYSNRLNGHVFYLGVDETDSWTFFPKPGFIPADQFFCFRCPQILLKINHLFIFAFVVTGMDDVVVIYSRITTPYSLQFFCHLLFDILTTDEVQIT